MGTEELVIKISGNIKNFDEKLKLAANKTEALEKKLASAAKVSGIAFAGLTAVIGGVAASAAKLEKVSVQFEVLTGSAQKATATIKELQNFAATTPFQFEGIAKAGAQLLGFGFEADALPKKLQEIGDVAAAVNAPLGDLSLIFGQVAAAGKLTGERLLQLQERAVPIGPALAETMGVAESSIKNLVSQGKVSFDDFEKAFASLSAEGGKAFGGMEKQSQTLAGLISTLKDNFALLAQAIGNEFLPVLKVATAGMIKFLSFIREHPIIAKMAAAVLFGATALAALATAGTVGGLVLLQLRAALIAANFQISLTTLAVRTLLGATGIGLLIVVIGALALDWEKTIKQMGAIWEGFVTFFTRSAGGFRTILEGLLDFDLDKVREGGKKVAEAFQDGIEVAAIELEAIDPDAGPSAQALKNEKLKEDLNREREIREEHRALLLEDSEAFRELDREAQDAFIEANLEKLKTDKEAESEVLGQTILKQQVDRRKADAQFIKDRKKHGETFAKINQVIHSDEVMKAKSAADGLVQLTQSKNSALKSLGKAAAVTQIGISTAANAADIFGKLNALVPFAAPAIGALGAASIIAFGVEQTSNVLAANQGGLVTGGTPGVDSVPAVLTPGELVSPAQSFDEVVESVADRRNAARGLTDVSGEESGGIAEIQISFKDDAIDFIEAELIERDRLGIRNGSV